MTTATNTINNNSEVMMHFSIRLADGSAVDSSKVDDKPAKFVMGDGSLTPNFEACLYLGCGPDFGVGGFRFGMGMDNKRKYFGLRSSKPALHVHLVFRC